MSVIFLGKWFGHRTGAQPSVVLRRQVPIRFDEPARSWFGGLPQMPDNIRWPRVAKGAPLHFIAQIACGDLPKQVWNGRGPRDGWLLVWAALFGSFLGLTIRLVLERRKFERGAADGRPA